MNELSYEELQEVYFQVNVRIDTIHENAKHYGRDTINEEELDRLTRIKNKIGGY
jgi:hypothetical protein|tara:strand:- start:415 stop:576 length:162 start_codon:yes stop_codon:yes gene_type:complete